MGLENSPAQEHLPAFAIVISTAVIITVSACEESQGLKDEKKNSPCTQTHNTKWNINSA